MKQLPLELPSSFTIATWTWLRIYYCPKRDATFCRDYDGIDSDLDLFARTTLTSLVFNILNSCAEDIIEAQEADDAYHDEFEQIFFATQSTDVSLAKRDTTPDPILRLYC